jgi:hypothetical protein
MYKFAPAVIFPPVASYGHQARIMDLPPIHTSLAILLTLVSIGLFFDPYWHARPTTPRISSGILVCTHQVVTSHWSSFGSGFATHNLYHAHTWIIFIHAISSVVRLVHFVYISWYASPWKKSVVFLSVFFYGLDMFFSPDLKIIISRIRSISKLEILFYFSLYSFSYLVPCLFPSLVVNHIQYSSSSTFG